MTKITINMSDNTIEIHSDQVLASDDNPLTEIDPPRVGARSLPMDWNVAVRIRELKFKMWDAAYVECKGNRTKMSKLLGYTNYQTLAAQMKNTGYIIPEDR
tara:strand:- start:557 stop:859 length:303 start_codon:yes stop_codon:yes gene_type:complete